MNIFRLVPVVLVLSVATPAFAGVVRGQVTATSSTSVAGSKVVVWIENAPVTGVSSEPLLLSQKDVRFSPTFMVAVAGQSVRMPNDDDLAHNVFSKSPAKAFDLGFYPKGESRTVTFTRPGLVDLFCRIHRHMNAKIFVVPNGYFAVTEPGGRFEIPGLPPGTYTVKVWHEYLSGPSRTVRLAEKDVATASLALTETNR